MRGRRTNATPTELTANSGTTHAVADPGHHQTKVVKTHTPTQKPSTGARHHLIVTPRSRRRNDVGPAPNATSVTSTVASRTVNSVSTWTHCPRFRSPLTGSASDEASFYVKAYNANGSRQA